MPTVFRSRADGGLRWREPIPEEVEEEEPGGDALGPQKLEERQPVTELIVGTEPGLRSDGDAQGFLSRHEGPDDLVPASALCCWEGPAGAAEFGQVGLGLDDEPVVLAKHCDPSDGIPVGG